MSLKVLYIDGVGSFGGASRSLFEVVRALPADRVEPHFLVQRGTIVPLYSRVARDLIATRGLTRFDNTRYGHYRGVRWLVLLRELFHIPFSVAGMFAARRRWPRIDIVHANEITELLPALLASKVFRAPLVVHVRSLQRLADRSWRSRWLWSLLRRHAAAIIAIDENVRATLPEGLRVEVIHNSFTPQPAGEADARLLARLGELRATSLKVGFVGNLHHSKGLFDLVEAARLAREAGADVEYVIVGGVTRDDRGLRGWLLRELGFAQNVHAQLRELIQRHGLLGCFHLIGPTTDIQRVYDRIDVLCFPSHFDAPGRPVFEAAFASVPSIVAVTCPRPDTLIPGQTGIAVPGQDPAKLAEALLQFACNRADVERMGAGARQLALRNFTPRANAAALYELYRRVAATGRAPVGDAGASNDEASGGSSSAGCDEIKRDHG